MPGALVRPIQWEPLSTRSNETRQPAFAHRKRALHIRSADEHFDSYGRLLAYVAPSYTREELLTKSRSEQATFSLPAVDSGWAASFPVSPSLLKYVDLVLLQQTAKQGTERQGWVSRHCVDMTTREVFLPQRYQKVQPHGWISIWAKDVVDAVDQMAVAVEVH